MSEPKLPRPELLAQSLPTKKPEPEGYTMHISGKGKAWDALAAIRRQGQIEALRWAFSLLRVTDRPKVHAALARLEAGGQLEEESHELTATSC